MCLIVKRQDPRFALKDRVVYKVLELDMRTIYYSFQYILHKLYATEMEESSSFSHADSQAERATEKEFGDEWRLEPEIMCIGKGYHTCATLQRARALAGDCGDITKRSKFIYACTIPKGSLYYEDNSELVVSDRLRIDRLIEET